MTELHPHDRQALRLLTGTFELSPETIRAAESWADTAKFTGHAGPLGARILLVFLDSHNIPVRDDLGAVEPHPKDVEVARAVLGRKLKADEQRKLAVWVKLHQKNGGMGALGPTFTILAIRSMGRLPEGQSDRLERLERRLLGKSEPDAECLEQRIERLEGLFVEVLSRLAAEAA